MPIQAKFSLRLIFGEHFDTGVFGEYLLTAFDPLDDRDNWRTVDDDYAAFALETISDVLATELSGLQIIGGNCGIYTSPSARIYGNDGNTCKFCFRDCWRNSLTVTSIKDDQAGKLIDI